MRRAVAALIAVPLGLVLGCEGGVEQPERPIVAPAIDAVPRPPPVDEYSVALRRGQTLSQLLSLTPLPATDQLLRALETFLNPRHLQPGTKLAYEVSATTVPFHAVDIPLGDVIVRAERWRDTWRATMDTVPLRTDTVVVGAELRAGESVVAAAHRAILSLPPVNRAVLVAEFAELYRDEVNFRRDMRPGDAFAVMAIRRVRPDGSVRDHHILAAQLTNQQRAHYRVFFSHSQGAGYFPPDGAAIRASLTRFPTRRPRITSSFKPRRRHPVLGIVRPHFGIDLHAPPGTPVQAVGDGRVTKAGREGGYGNAVFIDHGHGFASRYAHLARIPGQVRPGRRVVRGETIGFSGSSGNSAGPHVHYELLFNGRPIDPTRTRLPTDDPVGEDAVVAFGEVVRERLPILLSWSIRVEPKSVSSAGVVVP